jgi:hypothetical protein
MDPEAVEMLRAQLDARADSQEDHLGLVAEAIALAREAVRGAHRARARAREVYAASMKARDKDRAG